MNFKLYMLALPVMLVLDLIWLGLIAKGFYAGQIGHLMRPAVAMLPAALFYLLYPVAITVFALSPALDKQSLMHAVLLGGLLGLTAYGAYDLTNMATIKDWPLKMTIVDIAWGTFVTATTSGIAFIIAKKLGMK